MVCPGSRSTPLALALARDSRLRVHVRLDERSAAFFALGLSVATFRPVVVCTTSGTAAVELHPAVVEAYHSGVPLLVCTANRPPRLQRVGAPQVIDQTGLYGSSVVWSAAPGVPDWGGRPAWRSLASRAFAESLYGQAGRGPVHLDLAFEEPLVGSPAELPDGRAGERPWHDVKSGRPGHVPGIESLSGSRKRVLVVAGSGCGSPEAVLAAAEALEAPVLADPLSGCRLDRRGVVAASDAILRSDSAAAALRPDMAIRLGGLHASKVLSARLHEWSGAGTRQLLVDSRWRWPDPDRDADSVVRADPATWCEQVCEILGSSPTVRDRAWADSWSLAESEAQSAIEAWCKAHPEATEPGVGRALLGIVPPESTVVVASSMPVRDMEWYAPALDRPPKVVSNRGANGIDGVVSTALGVAAAGDGPVVAVVGDLAFLHDLSAWAGARPQNPGVTVVVVDNRGGGIFSFLPQRASVDNQVFEQLFGTPQPIGIEQAARGLGLEVRDARTMEDLVKSVRDSVTSGTTSVVRVDVPGRDPNVCHHDELNAEVARRVTGALGLEE